MKKTRKRSADGRKPRGAKSGRWGPLGPRPREAGKEENKTRDVNTSRRSREPGRPKDAPRNNPDGKGEAPQTLPTSRGDAEGRGPRSEEGGPKRSAGACARKAIGHAQRTEGPRGRS